MFYKNTYTAYCICMWFYLIISCKMLSKNCVDEKLEILCRGVKCQGAGVDTFKEVVSLIATVQGNENPSFHF